jgi:hypothetical protein
MPIYLADTRSADRVQAASAMGNPFQPLAKKDFDYGAAQHLLNRAGFGGTPAQVRALLELGLDDAVDYLVEFKGERVSNEGFEFKSDILRAQTPEERETLRRARATNDTETIARIERERQERQNADRAQIGAMKRWWLARMIETGRPLQEKLTLFWHGHFATGYRTIENSWHMLMQNGMLRSNCAGNFADLARGIISDPAMLKYLDNDENRKSSPNENLARELMELFTLGEGNGYGERDIKEGARALTGRTFRGNEYFFDRAQHDAGGKQILRRSGDFSGDDFVSIILEQPECSRFIAGKLYRFFVNDSPALTRRDGGAPGEGAARRAVRAPAGAAGAVPLAALPRAREPAVDHQEPDAADRAVGAQPGHARAQRGPPGRGGRPHGAGALPAAEREGLAGRALVDQHGHDVHAAEHGGVPDHGADDAREHRGIGRSIRRDAPRRAPARRVGRARCARVRAQPRGVRAWRGAGPRAARPAHGVPRLDRRHDRQRPGQGAALPDFSDARVPALLGSERTGNTRCTTAP